MLTHAPDDSAIFVDLGTTNTRVWLAQGESVLAKAQAQIGVRDTARDGSNQRLRETLRSLIDDVISDGQHESEISPRCVIAAGMITSSLGLAEVPHVQAPAGLRELAASTRRFDFPDITPLPFLLVPGVRTGSPPDDPARTDIMRGEETLCLGLMDLGLVKPESVVINLGSHWKTIRIDEQGRVAGSVTSLAGEMIHSAQTNTILASSLPSSRPQALDREWVQAGMREQRQSGLGRALFCVRLLDLDGHSIPEQRMAFLIGAFIASDMDALLKRGAIAAKSPVALIGATALAEAWRTALAEVGVPSKVASEEQIETALLTGLRRIIELESSR